ncbi:MAG: Rieske (2Fe-2S) protein [Alcanivoracaceae bacterium]|jgi:nitrite reductase/ring-hydroxylating ferredoxin subunit|nr:Rieske (2Fe-2S) protein [Alcanivoracaceae bacterium]
MQPVCATDQVPVDGACEVQVNGEGVVIVNRDGQFYAYMNWCPHLGIELNFMPDQFMDEDNTFIMCANHGALFEVESGNCLSGPCANECLKAVELDVRDGQIHLGELPATTP